MKMTTRERKGRLHQNAYVLCHSQKTTATMTQQRDVSRPNYSLKRGVVDSFSFFRLLPSRQNNTHHRQRGLTHPPSLPPSLPPKHARPPPPKKRRICMFL